MLLMSHTRYLDALHILLHTCYAPCIGITRPFLSLSLSGHAHLKHMFEEICKKKKINGVSCIIVY